MNERIKELAEQAGFMLWGNESWNPGDVVDWSARYDDELEKFAELIVRECIEVCKGRVGNSDYNTGRMHCMSDLKEHFGVED